MQSFLGGDALADGVSTLLKTADTARNYYLRMDSARTAEGPGILVCGWSDNQNDRDTACLSLVYSEAMITLYWRGSVSLKVECLSLVSKTFYAQRLVTVFMVGRLV